MQTIIQNIPVNYYTSDSFDNTKNTKKSLFLHGRGQNWLSFSNITKQLDQQWQQRISLDLPWFGKTPRPKWTWWVEEYSNFIQDFIQKKNLTDFDIVAHSFGCRIALMLSSQLSATSNLNINHQYLFWPAGVEKTINPVKKIIGKIAKKAFFLPWLSLIWEKLKNKLWSLDYKMAWNMKDVFVKIVNKDLTPILHKVQAPTTIIWGDQDDQILKRQVDIMKEKIPNCDLKIIEWEDHFVHQKFDFSIFKV